jgi:hypothetical protein
MPYSQLGWGMGWLPMNMGSGVSASFVRKNHIFATRPEDRTSGGGSRGQPHGRI